MDEALNLFRLPRSIGKSEGDEIVVGIGKYGPYLRHKNKFFSLKKGTDDPYTITLERSLEIIDEKRESDKQKVMKDFGDIQVLNGKYGPYIKKDRKNFRIPRGTDPATLSKEDCFKLTENRDKPKKSAI
jgi:DNA topoisomerase-1